MIMLVLPLAVRAQTISTDPFSINITPAYPSPYEPLTLSVGSGSVDMSNSTFKVFVNGALATVGTGASSVSLTASGPGTTMNIRVVVSSGGQQYQKTLAVRPLAVALSVEPLATLPPLYPGGATIPPNGSVRMVAVPTFYSNSGVYIDPATLSYTWSVGGQTLIASSGIGQSSVVVSAPLPYRQEDVSVLVQNQDGSLVASQSVALTPQNPLVQLYQKDPLMGIEYGHALSGQQTLSGVQTSFVAVPYGFSTDSGGPSIVWSLNGATAQTGDTITLQPQGAGQGSAALSAAVSDPASYESATAGFTAVFGSAQTGGFGLFGL